MHRIASGAAGSGQGHAWTSSVSAARRFASPLWPRHASMLVSASGSESLGWNARLGSAAANAAACSPVPLAISSTSPRAGSNALEHGEDRRRGCAPVAGAKRRASVAVRAARGP